MNIRVITKETGNSKLLTHNKFKNLSKLYTASYLTKILNNLPTA